MKKYFEILRKCRLFDNISDENLLTMLHCLGAEIRSYSKNQLIVTEGEKITHIGIILSGTAQLVRIDYYGNRSIVTNIEPSQLFGESFVCAETETVPVSVIASENCEAMLIDGRRIIQSCGNACEFHNQLIFNLMKVLATKNLLFNQKLEIISKRTTREKLMTYLFQQMKKTKSSYIEIPFNRQELADFLEVDRSGLSAEISRLRREKRIECRKNQFRIL
ncbi:MAG: Crp/Fnr family transcriptional regulator [Ruminococcus sp.]|nr:Crp/Fnr family transcriptional regulator [Ruminococcus sp.]